MNGAYVEEDERVRKKGWFVAGRGGRGSERAGGRRHRCCCIRACARPRPAKNCWVVTQEEAFSRQGLDWAEQS